MSLTPRPSAPPLLPLVFLLMSVAAVGGDGPEDVASAAVWSKFGLVVQKHAAGESPHTTETSGIIIRVPDPQTNTDRPTPQPQPPPTTPPPPPSTAVAPTGLGKSWTQISITKPPPPSKSTHLVTVSTPIKLTGHAHPVHSAYTASTTTARSTVQSTTAQNALREIPHRYQQLIGTSKPMITITFPPPRQSTLRPAYSAEQVTSKRVRQYEDDEEDDDDDDDDDDDEYDVEDDDDDDDVHEDKGEEEEIEEIVEVQHIDSDNYGEEKPSIVKKKRRRKKKGKKHKPFKVKDFKKLKKFMLPLLLAYKLKFFTLVPLMLGGLVLIVATTGFAGFFFALFAVGLGLKGHH